MVWRTSPARELWRPRWEFLHRHIALVIQNSNSTCDWLQLELLTCTDQWASSIWAEHPICFTGRQRGRFKSEGRTLETWCSSRVIEMRARCCACASANLNALTLDGVYHLPLVRLTPANLCKCLTLWAVIYDEPFLCDKRALFCLTASLHCLISFSWPLKMYFPSSRMTLSNLTNLRWKIFGNCMLVLSPFFSWI